MCVRVCVHDESEADIECGVGNEKAELVVLSGGRESWGAVLEL